MANPTCSNGSREDSALDPGFEAHLGNTSNSTLHISKGHKDPDSCSALLRLQNGNYRDLNGTPAATSSVALLPSDCLHPSSQQHRCGSQVHPRMLTGPCGAPEGPCPRQGTVRGCPGSGLHGNRRLFRQNTLHPRGAQPALNRLWK